MKQLLLILLKLIGFYIFYGLVIEILHNAFYIHFLDKEISDFGGSVMFFLYIITRPILQLILCYFLIFKTELLIKPFKLKFDNEINVSYESVLKLGIFLIGFYFLLTSLPFVLVQIMKWFTKEISTSNGFTGNHLFDTFLPFNCDTFLNAFIISTLSFFTLLFHKRIASYFIKEDSDKN